MNTQKLKDRVSYNFSGHGHYKVTIIFRGKKYTSITTNMPAIDRVGDNDNKRDTGKVYETPKQALRALYNEVKRLHNLK